MTVIPWHYPALLRTTCPLCGCVSSTVARRRMNTAYDNDARNFTTSCWRCYVETGAYWAERWQDYYDDIAAGLGFGAHSHHG